MSPAEMNWEKWVCLALRREAKVKFSAVLNYLIEGYEADGAKLCLSVHSEKTKTHADKLQHGKFQLETRKKKTPCEW